MYIGFEGPIGAGKTTLTECLREHLGASAVFEAVGENEFLAEFYEARSRFALPMQLWFLMARHSQLVKELQIQTPVIADYTFAKDGVFAQILLSDRELRLYDRIAKGLRPVRQPDLLVYLDADDAVLLERIAGRGRTYEKGIDKPYQDAIRAGYEHYFSHNPDQAVLRVNTTELDLSSQEQMKGLYSSILRTVRPRALRPVTPRPSGRE